MNLSWQTDEQGVGGVDDLSAIISNDKSSSLSRRLKQTTIYWDFYLFEAKHILCHEYWQWVLAVVVECA